HATRRRAPVHAPSVHTVELSADAAVDALVARLRPDVVIHAAYGKQDLARDVVRATRNVAAACARTGTTLVHVSTDVVFDGEQAPYSESDPPAPISDYGRSKAEAEGVVRSLMPGAAIVRTSVIVRTDAENEIVRQLRDGSLPPAFVDELRSVIAVADLAAQLWELALLPKERIGGVWHLAGPEAVSRYALAALLALRHGIDPRQVKPALNRDFHERRPRDLRLLTARADRELRTRVRPISEALFGATIAGLPQRE
ncbi:MAG TPA: sugar nucleotide-binding protein, partial [Longimicrobiaceae bacterium]|nr:sugar nucleotide-binding protein [Longimicrobiaceae bacterium]